MMRFLRYGLRLTRYDPQIDPQIDPDMTSQLTLQTGPEMASDDPPGPHIQDHTQNKALFQLLLTIAELEHEPSKDWIRPPSQSQE